MGFIAFLFFLFFSVISGETHHAAKKETYLVRVDHHSRPTVFPDLECWYRSFVADPKDLIYIYTTVFGGFAASINPSELSELKKRPEILLIAPDRSRRLHSNSLPQRTLLHHQRRRRLVKESDYGSDVIIGVVDTGIWPEHRSFHDEGLGPVPTRWNGECMEGIRFSKENCNKKLIGASFFLDGYERNYGPLNNSDYRSARDSVGHGTHTASTAAGRAVNGASMFGFASGTATGVAPKARIAVYKVCWLLDCHDSDIISGVDKAVQDGVDVLSISLGAARLLQYHNDPIAISTFRAVERGVFVSAAAGNSGPAAMTVINFAPWITTVGAGTIDRDFPADVTLGDGRIIRGVGGIYNGSQLQRTRLFPLVHVETAHCMRGLFSISKVLGNIVFCKGSSMLTGEFAKKAGAAGMVLTNSLPTILGTTADPQVLPTVQISEKAGSYLHFYIATSTNPHCSLTFHGTELGVKPAPVLASFSARGPNPVSPYIIKPDVIAPGVNILAAWPDNVGPSGSIDERRVEFNIMSGTSMSCPHVSGIAALLRGVHRDWSPAAIRSALMTTAYVHDSLGGRIIDAATANSSTVWDIGSGHVDPNKAVDPGLVYDSTAEDYIRFLCDSNYTVENLLAITRRMVTCDENGAKRRLWDLNYPSISIVFDGSSEKRQKIKIKRRLMNVGEGAAVYKAEIKSPRGTQITVHPTQIRFKRKGHKKNFMLRVKELKERSRQDSESSLIWTDGSGHIVRSPIAVTWKKPTRTPFFLGPPIS